MKYTKRKKHLIDLINEMLVKSKNNQFIFIGKLNKIKDPPVNSEYPIFTVWENHEGIHVYAANISKIEDMMKNHEKSINVDSIEMKSIIKSILTYKVKHINSNDLIMDNNSGFLCPCQNGLKYRYCCQPRHKKKSLDLHVNELISIQLEIQKEMFSPNKNNTCYHLGCKNKPIQSHSISKSFELKKICNKSNEVMELVFNKSPKKQKNSYTACNTSWKKASSRSLFCTKHDSELFVQLDNPPKTMKIEDFSAIILKAIYRTTIHRLDDSLAKIKAIESLKNKAYKIVSAHHEESNEKYKNELTLNKKFKEEWLKRSIYVSRKNDLEKHLKIIQEHLNNKHFTNPYTKHCLFITDEIPIVTAGFGFLCFGCEPDAITIPYFIHSLNLGFLEEYNVEANGFFLSFLDPRFIENDTKKQAEINEMMENEFKRMESLTVTQLIEVLFIDFENTFYSCKLHEELGEKGRENIIYLATKVSGNLTNEEKTHQLISMKYEEIEYNMKINKFLVIDLNKN